MQIIKQFNEIGSSIYDTPRQASLAKAGKGALDFSENFGLTLVKTCDRLAHGFKTEERKFQAELLKSRSEGNGAFKQRVKKEREFFDLLINCGVINDRITWKDRAAMIVSIASDSLFLGATSPLSLSCGTFAVGIRAYLQNRMHPLTCLTPPFHKTWEEGDPITVFTANIAGTEFCIMDYINGVSATKPRIEQWAKLLVELKPDVICLQEAFDIDVIYPILAKALQKEGYYVVMTTKRAKVFGMTSGLFLASRFPIEDVGFHEYTDRQGIDRRAAKGVLPVRIALNEDVKICVATTHMQSGYPRGSTKQKIKWKKEQFDQATNFINLFNEKCEVRDVFLVGDFNDGRFAQRTTLEVETDYQYPSIIKGLLEKGYKDLTVPNRNDSFEDYFEHETEFDPHDPDNVETGSSRGSCFNTWSPSYRHFITLIALIASEELLVPVRSLIPDVKKRLLNIDIGNEDWTKAIDDSIQEVKKGMYVKANTVDHMCQLDKEDNVFDEQGYDYRVITAPFLTDHRNLLFTLFPKDSDSDT